MTSDTEIATSTNDLNVSPHQIEDVTTPENEDDFIPSSIPMITPEKEITHDQGTVSQTVPTQDNITCISTEHDEYVTMETVEYQPKLLQEKEIHDQKVFHQSRLRH